jgi:DNA-binding HxlR family transcriptional regulator
MVEHPDYSRCVARLHAFDQFQKSLNIAPNMLTRRLTALVDGGLLERRRYSQPPPRYEYILTDIGHDFCPVIVAMFAWGNRHFAPEGPSVLLVDKKSQRVADPVRRSRRPLRMPDGASIILNASIVASKGLSSNIVYSATKPAVRSFARTWTTDLKNRRIRVNAVSPGSIDTPGLSTYCLPQKSANNKRN